MKLFSNKKINIFTFCYTFIVITAVFSYPLSIMAAENTGMNKEPQKILTSDTSISYDDYIKKYENIKSGEINVTVDSALSKDDNGQQFKATDIDTKEHMISLSSETSGARFSFEILSSGFYNIGLDYSAGGKKGGDILLDFMVDGAFLFSQAKQVNLKRSYTNEVFPFKTDVNKNQLRPQQIEIKRYSTEYFSDNNGYYNEPFKIFFETGMHSVYIKFTQEGAYIKKLIISPLQSSPDYSVIKEQYDKSGYAVANDRVRVEGEDAILKSSPMLFPSTDRISSATSPSDPTLILLNTIGQNNWKIPGQVLTYNVKVNKTGLYSIAFRVKQNYNRGMISSRRLMIDGKLLYNELGNIQFPFNIDWYVLVAGGDKPYKIYLEEGVHTFSLEAILGDMSDTLKKLENMVYTLNNIYRKVIQITGVVPDRYRDYNLDKAIPGLVKDLKIISSELKLQARVVEGIVKNKGSQASFLLEFANQIDSFIENPTSIPLRLDSFKGNISSLGSWLLSIKEQPLELDYFELYPTGLSAPKAKSDVFEEISFAIKGFMGSFYIDYNSIGVLKKGDNANKSIKVWVNSGRDQAQIVRGLIDEQFTPDTNTAVKLNLVNGSDTLIQATLAGKGPDIALLVANDLPVNLAMRGALTNLKNFEGFKKIEERFYPSAYVKYQFNGGIYAIPNTQDYNMLFYRTDIFNELGINPPDNWDDFYKILPIIQHNNLDVGIPTDQGFFETLIYQNGGTFFNESLTKTNFDTTQALDAFKMWTDFFTDYSVPLVYDFYNRFRTGEMPMGIAPYTTYNILDVLAPELKGLWKMTKIPGTKKVDGTINRAETSSGTASVLMERSKDKQSAFSFLDWWTSDRIQAKFGIEIEGLMGPAARYNVANIKSLEMLPWQTNEYNMLMEQWKTVYAVPQIPSSYDVTRNVTNAFRNVVYYNYNEREILNKYAKYIDTEIERKNKEYRNKLRKP